MSVTVNLKNQSDVRAMRVCLSEALNVYREQNRKDPVLRGEHDARTRTLRGMIRALEVAEHGDTINWSI